MKKRTRAPADIVTYRGTTYPWQCDHVGHVNIMWYVSKFDEANWNLFANIGITHRPICGSSDSGWPASSRTSATSAS